MRRHIFVSVKYGLIGGFVTAIVTWRRHGVAVPIMYLMCLLAGALAGREARRSQSILVAALAGFVGVVVSNLAFSVWITTDALTEFGLRRGAALTMGEMPYAVLGGVGGVLLNPYALRGIVFGTVLGVIGGLVSRALMRSPDTANTGDAEGGKTESR